MTGNAGASETALFSVEVPEPFPTNIAAATSGISIAIVAVGLVFFYKKRKR